MSDRKNNVNNIVVIGLALFAMFFGAGNLIFPPYLGMTSGTDWFLGFFCFIMADIGLAFVTIIAMMKGDGSISGVTGVIGKIPSLILNTAVIVCIGPLLAIPRTAATTYEMAILPVTGNISPLIFSILFFAVVLVLTIRPSKIIDIVGKFLTPLMFIALLALIIAGVMHPMGTVGEPTSQTIVKDGILAGYQAMDVLGALGFAIIIVSAVAQKGYGSEKERVRVTSLSCVIAGIILFIVYGGLTYLGASSGSAAGAGLNQAGLIVAITQGVLGNFGVIMLGIIVGLACLTTAIGLTSAAGSYFDSITKGKMKYESVVVVTTLLGIVVCNFGLSNIISIAVPILTILYPLVVVLIVLSLFKKKLRNLNVYRGAALVTLAISIISVVDAYSETLNIVSMLPFDAYGFNWVIPAAIGGCIGAFFKNYGEEHTVTNEKFSVESNF